MLRWIKIVVLTATATIALVSATTQAQANPQRVDPISKVEEMLRSNPHDPRTLNLAWRIYLATAQWEKGLSAGQELIRVDPAAGDTTFYIRNTAVATVLSPTRGAEMVALGLARYPDHAPLLVLQADLLYQLGQKEKALSAINRALTIRPALDGGYAQKALILSSMNDVDSVVTTIRAGVAHGANRKTLAQVALKAGSDVYQTGKASPTRMNLQHAVDLLLLSNELEPSDEAMFLAGSAAFLAGQNALTEAREKNDCDLARFAHKSFATAKENVPAGLQSYSDAALQLLKAMPQLDAAVDKQLQQSCN
jgi:tetratricopeptide (TPR) repeat protein